MQPSFQHAWPRHSDAPVQLHLFPAWRPQGSLPIMPRDIPCPAPIPGDKDIGRGGSSCWAFMHTQHGQRHPPHHGPVPDPAMQLSLRRASVTRRVLPPLCPLPPAPAIWMSGWMRRLRSKGRASHLVPPGLKSWPLLYSSVQTSASSSLVGP